MSTHSINIQNYPSAQHPCSIKAYIIGYNKNDIKTNIMQMNKYDWTFKIVKSSLEIFRFLKHHLLIILEKIAGITILF